MFRFTIIQHLVFVGLVAGLIAAYQTYGRVVPYLVIPALVGGLFIKSVLRDEPTACFWLFLTSALVGNITMALLLCYVLDWPTQSLVWLGSPLSASFAIGCGPIVVANKRLGRRTPAALSWFLVLLAPIMTLSMAMTPWPIKVAFAISKPWMERLADRVSAGESLKRPEWVGIYRVVDAEVDPKSRNIALYLDANPHVRSGFVRVTNPKFLAGPMGRSAIREAFGNSWSYQIED